LLDLALILVVSLHLIAANVSTAAPFVCIWLARRERRRGDVHAGHAGRFLAWHSLTSVAVASLLGGTALAILWAAYPNAYLHAAGRISRQRYEYGVAELAIYAACILLYAFLWQRRGGPSRYWAARVFELILALFAGTNLAYHFPTLFAAIGVLSTSPWPGTGEPGEVEIVALLLDPQTIARTVHFWLASCAVTGALLIVFALRMERRGEPAEAWSRLAIWGGRLAFVPTLLQLAAGVAVLATLPPALRDRLLGGDARATILFTVSIVTALGLMHRLATVALGEVGRGQLRQTLAWMAVVVVTMVAARDYARQEIFRRAETTAASVSSAPPKTRQEDGAETGHDTKQIRLIGEERMP